MANEIQVIIDEQKIAKVSGDELLKAFGAPFTEAGEILAHYQEIEVTDVDQRDLMAIAKSRRLILKKIRTTVENTRKELKEDSLRKGKAIDAVARYIREHIQPAEDYLELQEKFAERLEESKRLQEKTERIEKLSKVCDNPYDYQVETMDDIRFERLLKELTESHELRLKQEKAYADQLEKERADKEAEDIRIREENEILKKQAIAREVEIEAEREQQQIIQEAEIKAVKVEVESELCTTLVKIINLLNEYKCEELNEFKPMVDKASVIKLIKKAL